MPAEDTDPELRTIEPEPELKEDPENNEILPPTLEEDVEPAEKNKPPPEAEVLGPTIRLTEPARPLEDEPVVKERRPEFPDTEEPELTLTLPEAPTDRTAALPIVRLPLPELLLVPERTETEPPNPDAELPPSKDAFPPAEAPEEDPDDSRSRPATSPVPASKLTEPAV